MLTNVMPSAFKQRHFRPLRHTEWMGNAKMQASPSVNHWVHDKPATKFLFWPNAVSLIWVKMGTFSVEGRKKRDAKNCIWQSINYISTLFSLSRPTNSITLFCNSCRKPKSIFSLANLTFLEVHTKVVIFLQFCLK